MSVRPLERSSTRVVAVLMLLALAALVFFDLGPPLAFNDDWGMSWEASWPGASFLITVPAGPELWTEHDVSFGHFRRYTMAGLEQAWRGLPVTTLMLSYYNSHPNMSWRVA